MLNCKNCGAPLTLDDAVCPHCGTPNEEAAEHIKELRKLKKDFKKTEKEVITEVKKTKKGYNLLIMIVMLLIANLVLAVMHSASYEIAERIAASDYDKEEVKAMLDDCLREEDFTRFVMVYDKYVLDYKDFEEYNPIDYQAYDYNNIRKQVSNYFYQSDPFDDPLVRACSAIKEYEDEYARIIKRNTYGSFTMEQLKKLDDQVNQYLKTYLKLTDEDIASINDMTNSELVILVTRRLNNEE